MHSKFEGVYVELSGLCEKYEAACREKARLHAQLQPTSYRRHRHHSPHDSPTYTSPLQARLHSQLQLAALEKAAVIGMTVAALAKFAPLVAALDVEVVVVDGAQVSRTPQLRPPLGSAPQPTPHSPSRAQNILESQLLVALGASTRHLVLVGDRVAVRPGGPVARLSRTFRLDVSLFERLLRGGVEHASLSAQRRLPPAITRLLLPVYPTLSDHPSTLRRPAVAGVERPVFFLAHERPEGLDPETGSRTNAHEAKFVAALAAYLLRQGYAPPQLAIVSPYCGQRRLIKQCLAEAGAAEVRAASVDHIDEADVVLLSLVRSNDGAKLGLLEEELLACRAVSRARLGLYVVGNAKMLYGAENGGLWEGMLKALKQADATGNFLPLLATRGLGGRRALVRAADDFVGIATEHERAQPGYVEGK